MRSFVPASKFFHTPMNPLGSGRGDIECSAPALKPATHFHPSSGPSMNESPYLWPPRRQPSLPVKGRHERAPVNRIFCVGRNYHAHAVEMGRPVDKLGGRPFYFI